MSANDTDEPQWRLRDFPAVFLSYDEPWADRNWLDLKTRLPRVTRVHGVKGLDACHKAAAAAVPGDWVVTVDADTRVGPALADAVVPVAFLTGNFRLDWLSRNSVNGLWSGNGCVKLWPKALIEEMRTHEAAPEGRLSLDHEVSGIRTGKSAQVMMPERAAMTDPAVTAFHGFRAGLRETVFLRNLAEEAAARKGGMGWQSEAALARLTEVWCSIGRHAPNGHWVLYGARLGLSIKDLWPDWDLRQVNDHDAIHRLWTRHILPRFQRGSASSAGECSWNWQTLEADLALFAQDIEARGGPALAEFDTLKSRALAESALLASPITPSRIDAAGYRMLIAATTGAEQEAARDVLQSATLHNHPAAHLNLGTLLGRQARPDVARAAWHFRVAALLGNTVAAERLDALEKLHKPDPESIPEAFAAADLPVIRSDATASQMKAAARGTTKPFCIVADAEVGLSPLASRHVPDPDLFAAVAAMGYLSLCPVTGLPRPRGIRVVATKQLAAGSAEHRGLVYPVVLGLLPPPTDATDALRSGALDAGLDIPPLLATLGRDGLFGDHWVLGSLLGRLGRPLSSSSLRRLAMADAMALAADIARLAQDLSRQTGATVPVWTAQESRALKRLIPAVPGRSFWQACAAGLSQLGPVCRAHARVLQSSATAIWGCDPALT